MADTKKYVSPSLSSEEEFICSFCRLVLRTKGSEDIIHWAGRLGKKDPEIADIVAKILAIGITDIQLGPKGEYIIRADKDVAKSVKANENLYKMFQYLYKKAQRAMDNANLSAIEDLNAKLGNDEIEHDLEDEGILDKPDMGDEGDEPPTEEAEAGGMEARPEEEAQIARTKRELEHMSNESYDSATDGEDEYLRSTGLLTEDVDEVNRMKDVLVGISKLKDQKDFAGKLQEYQRQRAKDPEGALSKLLDAAKQAGLQVGDQDIDTLPYMMKPDGSFYAGKDVDQVMKLRNTDKLQKNTAPIVKAVGTGSSFEVGKAVADMAGNKMMGTLKKPMQSKLAGVVDNSLASIKSSRDKTNLNDVDDIMATHKMVLDGALKGKFVNMDDAGTVDAEGNDINIDTLQGMLDSEAKAGNRLAIQERQKKQKMSTTDARLATPKHVIDFQKDNLDLDPNEWENGLMADEAVDDPAVKEETIPTEGEDRSDEDEKPLVSRFSDIPVHFKQFVKDEYEPDDIAPKSVAVSAVDNESSSFAVIFDTFDKKSFAEKVANAFKSFIGFETEEMEIVSYKSDVKDLNTFQVFFYGVSMPEHGSEYDEIHNPYKHINQYKARQIQTAPNTNFFKAKNEARIRNSHDGFVERMMRNFGDLFRD